MALRGAGALRKSFSVEGSFTIVNIYLLIQRVLIKEWGDEASYHTIFKNVDLFVEHNIITKINASKMYYIILNTTVYT